MVAVTVFEQETLDDLPEFTGRIGWFLEHRPELRESITSLTRPGRDGKPITRWLMALPSRVQLGRVLRHLLDESEFLSPYGIRSLSRYHEEHPYILDVSGQHLEVKYLPGESDTTMFGGNSNWRGPVWFPINALLIEALHTYHLYYGDTFQVEFPTGSGHLMNLGKVAEELTERLVSVFRPDESGRRPCHGGQEIYARDPNWRDLILFNEYFHGDTGRGCGASHQTGWTGLVAALAWFLAHPEASSAESTAELEAIKEQARRARAA